MLKNPSANAGDAEDFGLIPGLGRFPGGRSGNHSSTIVFKSSMGRGAWRVHGVAKSQTCLSKRVYIYIHVYILV